MTTILDAGATSLAGVLVAQPNYLSLSLNNNRIGDVGATQLRRAVRRNRDLYMLDVANNRIGRRALAELRATLDLNIKEQVFRKNVYGKYAHLRQIMNYLLIISLKTENSLCFFRFCKIFRSDNPVCSSLNVWFTSRIYN